MIDKKRAIKEIIKFSQDVLAGKPGVISKFRGPVNLTQEQVLEYARWKFRAIQTRMTDQEKVAHINKCLVGISFNLEQLKCKE